MHTEDNAHSEAVEQAILSVVMDGRHADAWPIVLENCPTPDYFFQRNNQLIALVCNRMMLAGKPINAQTVISEARAVPFAAALNELRALRGERERTLEENGSGSLCEAIGGSEYIHGLASATGFAAALADNCETLAGFYRQRKAIETLSKKLEKLQAPDGRKLVENLVDETVSEFSGLTAKRGKTLGSQASASALRIHDDMAASGVPIRTGSYGLKSLDDIIPLAAGRFVIVSASPGCGKTSLMLMAAMETSKKLGPKSVGIISLEMDANDLQVINLARESGIDAKLIETGSLSPPKRELIQRTKEQMDKCDFYLRDESGLFNVDNFCAWVRQRQIESKGQLHLVCLDYIQLLDPVHPKHSEYQRISDITRKLKKLARETRVCVLGLSQMNRGGTKNQRGDDGELKNNPEPSLSDLHGSGSLEKDSDAVCFIWSRSPKQINPTLTVNFKVAKNRKGRVGEFSCEFRRASGQRFVEIATGETKNCDVYSRTDRMSETPSDEEDLLA